MNAKLAREIGRRLGMQKKAAPPATTKAFKSFPLPEDSETIPGVSALSALVGSRGDIGGPHKDSYTLSGEAAGSLPKTEPAPEPWAGGGTAAKQKADATVGAKAGPLSLGGATSSGATPDANGVMSLGNKGVAGAGAATPPDANGVLSVGGAGGGAGPDDNGVLTLDPSTRKQLGGGGQPGQGNDFWSLNPEQGRQATGDMFNKYLGFNSPSQYTAWQQARASGMGRALRARANNQWIRSMFAE